MHLVLNVLLVILVIAVIALAVTFPAKVPEEA